jgi:acyl-CoA reductase-like NAD-dependent aldehyde dehydrogenase
MKGEAYRRYYEENKDRILNANKERAKKRREQFHTLSEEDREALREKHRAKLEKRRMEYYKVVLDELGKLHKDDEYGSLYKTLSESPCIKDLPPSMFDWLVSVCQTN